MLIVLALVALASEPHQVEARSDWEADRWISEIDARANQVDTLRYSVRRTTERADNTVKERWRFLRSGNRFRVDYFGDTARQISFDGHTLLDYVPEAGAALRVEVSSLPVDQQMGALQGVLEKVAVPGFRVGVAEGVTWTLGEATTLFGRPAMSLHGAGEQGTLHYVVDTDRVALLRTELLEEARVIVRTDSRAHKEILPGVWFPSAVEMWMPAEGGEVRVIMEVTRVATEPVPENALFDLALDPGIPVRTTP